MRVVGSRHGEKVENSPGTPGPHPPNPSRPPGSPETPRTSGTSSILWNPGSSLGPPTLLPVSGTLQNPHNPLGPQESVWDHRYSSGLWSWKGLIISFLRNSNKFVIFKKQQFVNYINFLILNCLFYGRNLLEIFNSLLRSCVCDNWKASFCLALHLIAVHFRDKLQHVGDVSEQKSSVDQSELEQ